MNEEASGIERETKKVSLGKHVKRESIGSEKKSSFLDVFKRRSNSSPSSRVPPSYISPNSSQLNTTLPANVDVINIVRTFCHNLCDPYTF
jgi:hypothetical protein